MNNNPETDLDLDKLFLPAWAQEPATANRYAKYEGRGADDRPERRGEGFGRRPGGGPRDARRDRPPRRDGGPRAGQDRGHPPRRDDRGQPGPARPGPYRDERRERPPAPPLPLPEITVEFRPDDKGVDSLARQIRMTGRAYPLFDIAQLILQRPERHFLTFRVKKNADGQPMQPLFLCALDDTLWLSEDEAVAHVLDRHFTTFYQAERTATEPPKGKYTFVAQCALSGVILGPPNYHDYQNQVRKLHAERFSRMPFEVFKSRIRIVRDEAVVKKWIDDQSWKTEYVCLNVPEALRLASREAVEKHFREVHRATIIKPVDAHTLDGKAARALRSPGLARLVRGGWEQQRRFPLPVATTLSQQFAARGLQFFKVNRFVTHVSVARPHFLDLSLTPVSEGIRHIVEFINAHPKCTRRKLVEGLAPSPTMTAPTPPVPAPAEMDRASAAPDTTAPAAEAAAPPAEPTAPAPAAVSPGTASVESTEPTPEQTAVIADLHWLIHQGHVLEFANGILETAKKPLPKPPKPEAKPAAAQPAGEAASTAEPKAEGEPLVTAEEAALAGQAADAGGDQSVGPAEAAPPPEPGGPVPVETMPPDVALGASTEPPVAPPAPGTELAAAPGESGPPAVPPPAQS